VIKRETGSWRWMFITFGYMLTLAYVAAFATYQIAVRLGGRLIRPACLPPAAARSP